MNLAQSPHVPENGKRPNWRDFAWLASYSARALFELVRARSIFARLEAKAIPNRNRKARVTALESEVADEAALARIAYVIPRLSDRLPWRSDCTIQAIAAQNWLSTIGVYSEIQIGVENPAHGEFGAHAWLMCGDSVVTGGDISKYDLILAGSDQGVDNDSSN
jgi:hypothetical protein